MIKKIVSFAGIVLWMTAFAGTAQAQSRQAYIVSVPFAFMMGDRAMAPGEYEVRVNPGSVLQDDNFNLITLRNRKGRDFKTLVTGVAAPLASNQKAELGFQRFGNRAFLTELKTSGRAILIPLSRSQAQREIAQQYKEEEIVTLSIQ